MEGEKKEQPTYEELEETINKQCMEMARIQAENLRKDMTIQKLCKENGTSKKQLREEVKEKNAIENQTKKELEKVKKELQMVNVSKRYASMLGMNEKDADEAARHEINKDMESWVKVIERHVKKVRMEAEQEALQSFLANRPEIRAGIGDVNRNASSLEIAKQYSRNRVNIDILDQY